MATAVKGKGRPMPVRKTAIELAKVETRIAVHGETPARVARLNRWTALHKQAVRYARKRPAGR